MGTRKRIHREDCSVEGCKKPIHVKSRGLCILHYTRWIRYGNVFAKNYRRGEKCKSYIKNGIAYIELTQNKWAKCSPYDLEYLLQWTWCTTKKERKYFIATCSKFNKHFIMHRLIAMRKFGSIPKGLEVDHKDRNPLNNQRENIRLATSSQNKINREKSFSVGNTQYKGICWDKQAKEWRARIAKNGNVMSKRFKNEKDAALWYNQKAIELFGEFAYLNEI